MPVRPVTVRGSTALSPLACVAESSRSYALPNLAVLKTKAARCTRRWRPPSAGLCAGAPARRMGREHNGANRM